MFAVFGRRRDIFSRPPSTPVVSYRIQPLKIIKRDFRRFAGAVIILGYLHRPASVVATPAKPKPFVVSQRVRNVRIPKGARLAINSRVKRAPLTAMWLAPQDQVNAGYPIYIQPAELTGSYEEVIDYGTIINNIIAVITYNTNIVTPLDPVSIVVKMAVSNDNISYSAFTSGASQFFPQFRYLKFRLEFSGNKKALVEVYNLTIQLNVKRENDGGEVSALSSDVGGTPVTFNKAFLDIESLTATVKSTTEPYIVIIKFTDIPNPTTFYVFAFDTTGNRVSKTVEWKARGIV